MQHDPLENKIAAELQRICDENHLNKIHEVIIHLDYHNQIEDIGLRRELTHILQGLVDSSTIITIEKKKLGQQEASIYLLKGEK